MHNERSEHQHTDINMSDVFLIHAQTRQVATDFFHRTAIVVKRHKHSVKRHGHFRLDMHKTTAERRIKVNLRPFVVRLGNYADSAGDLNCVFQAEAENKFRVF